MQAYLKASQDWINLGPDSAVGLRRAARLLRKDVFQCIELDDPVPTALYASDAAVDFGALVRAGLMSRDIDTADLFESDGFDVIYTVIDNVSFIDTHGNRWILGTWERWMK